MARKAIRGARDALSRIFYQRCFYLFAMLLALIGVVPFVPPTDFGRLVLNAINMFLLVATIATVGRTTMSFVVAVLLALPIMWFQYQGLWRDDEMDIARAHIFSAVLYFLATLFLLRYVFQRDVMTADKLFGAAASYLMIAVLWAYLYAIIGHFYPKSFLVVGQPGGLAYIDALYLSITVLTSTGFGDITPLTRQARGACMLEQITGALYVAILIARLAGVYPPVKRRTEEPESE
jgi:hypothetical protein